MEQIPPDCHIHYVPLCANTVSEETSEKRSLDSITKGKENNESMAASEDLLVKSFSLFNSTFMLKRKTWNLDIQPQKSNMKPLLELLIHSQRKTTMRIIIDKYKFKCHGILLRNLSTFFLKLGNVKYVKLPKRKVTPLSFYCIYCWILSRKLCINCLNAIELFKAVDYLGIETLKNHCWTCFDNITLFDENIAYEMYIKATKHNLPDLQELLLSRICKFFLPLAASEEFVKLSFNQVVRILKMNNLGVNTEIEIFMSCIRWLRHDWLHRYEHIMELMDCVRFKLLPMIFLHYLLKLTTGDIMHYITTLDVIRNRIMDAFNYVTMKLYDKEAHLSCNDPERPQQRRWIYDRKCSYHHDLCCPKRQFVSYEEFLNYLKTICESSNDKDSWRSVIFLKDVKEPFHCCSYNVNA